MLRCWEGAIGSGRFLDEDVASAILAVIGQLLYLKLASWKLKMKVEVLCRFR